MNKERLRMNKFLKIFVLGLVITFVNTSIVSASILKNFYGYQVKNVNIRELMFEINSALDAYQV